MKSKDVNAMTRIILSGCGGTMGKVITKCVAERQDCCIAAGIDPALPAGLEYPVFASPDQCTVTADVIIDFSHPSALTGLLEFAKRNSIPAVVATTGLSQAQVAQIREASAAVPLFFTANMSLGVNLLAELARKAAAVLSDSFDIEILEKHHNKKIDAPSGTALMLADEINDALGNTKEYVYDRHSVRKRREPQEIGIQSVRGGTIVGEHEIIFAGRDELVTLTHTAMSKEIFAVGAINAALYLADQPVGLYSMKDLIASV